MVCTKLYILRGVISWLSIIVGGTTMKMITLLDAAEMVDEVLEDCDVDDDE